MKRVFFLIALLFTVVCYAAPPPDLVPDIVPGQSAYVVQDNAVISTPINIEVQEVAYNYIGNCEAITSPEFTIELMSDMEFKISGINENYATTDLVDSNKPPGHTDMYMGAIVNNKFGFQGNLQNSNFGYPLTADNC